jgi:hypothetical protein
MSSGVSHVEVAQPLRGSGESFRDQVFTDRITRDVVGRERAECGDADLVRVPFVDALQVREDQQVREVADQRVRREPDAFELRGVLLVDRIRRRIEAGHVDHGDDADAGRIGEPAADPFEPPDPGLPGGQQIRVQRAREDEVHQQPLGLRLLRRESGRVQVPGNDAPVVRSVPVLRRRCIEEPQPQIHRGIRAPGREPVAIQQGAFGAVAEQGLVDRPPPRTAAPAVRLHRVEHPAPDLPIDEGELRPRVALERPVRRRHV